MQPNIVFVTVDQMRGDCLGILGHPVLQTPYLDNLARTGVVYRSAYSATPSCIPARAAIFTGMSQRSHGRVGYQDKVPWDYQITLPGELAKAGYHTQCVGKMHVYPNRSLCGFHNVVLHDGYLHYRRKAQTPADASWDQIDDYTRWLRGQAGVHHDMIDHGLDVNSATITRPYPLPEHLHPTNWVVSESIDFLRRRDPRKPFFLWMSFVRPHPPFDPPQTFFDMYVNEPIPEPPVSEWAEQEDPARRGLDPNTGGGIVEWKKLRRAIAAYYALITHIDHQIGRFMIALREYGLANNTLVIFTSDHGEMLGDHHLFRKCLPYEGSAKIPLLINDLSGKLKLQKGSIVDQPVELRDIMPTLLDAAGAEVPGSVEGMSLLPLARKQPVEWREYVHGEHPSGKLSNQYLTDGCEKYIWFSQTGREQLFDLRSDPQELRSLADEPQWAERLQLWRSRLIRELNGREEGYTDGQRLIVGRKTRGTLSHILPSEE